MEIWWGDFGDVVGILWRYGGEILWIVQGLFMIFGRIYDFFAKKVKVSTSRKYATKGEIGGGEFNSPEIDEETKSPTQRREGDVL